MLYLGGPIKLFIIFPFLNLANILRKSNKIYEFFASSCFKGILKFLYTYTRFDKNDTLLELFM